ncbi:MAG: hypothetical protein IPQ08_02320 [Chitinophagaceae bacterium]|nr:hypothetical protein [Chitinophagaceae bacterium]
MKKIPVLLLLCSLAFAANAQNNFLLYSFKGNVTVVENNVESKAKVGRSLTAASTIKLAAGGMVTLICNEAAMFTVSKAGTYALKAFGDSCKVSSNSITANYVKYVWASMTKTGDAPGSNRKAYMNTVGAVSRSINNIWIDPRLDTVNFSGIGADFPLSWKSYTEAKDFEFKIFSIDNLTTPVFSSVVSKMKIPISNFASKLSPGKSYLWTVSVRGEENEEMKVLNYVTRETAAAFLANVKNQTAGFEAAAEESYRMGFMMEDGHYLPEAWQYYTKAAAADASNVLYRSTLMSFKKDYEIK